MRPRPSEIHQEVRRARGCSSGGGQCQVDDVRVAHGDGVVAGGGEAEADEQADQADDVRVSLLEVTGELLWIRGGRGRRHCE